jgi:60 kDa SS-A/Ro ribonucleoprotein
MKTNTKTKSIHTHEGATAKHINAEQMLRRSVMSCFLWENEFYEDGQEIGARIAELADKVSPDFIKALAVEARHEGKLRHVPLWLICQVLRRPGSKAAETIAKVISRVDEIPELLALYWKAGKRPLAKQLRKGVAKAFHRFDEYQFAKYDRDGAVKLRDALRMCRPKPKDAEQAALFGRIKTRTLKTPETWEVQLSGGGDKKEVFEGLLKEGKLGYLALLRNLRNMMQSGCNKTLVKEAILARKGAQNVLPFRFVAAARACVELEPVLDQALIAAINESAPLSGRTVVLVDVSGSMDARLSTRSDLDRMDAAATLASIINGEVRVFTFSNDVREVAPRKGMAGVDVIKRSQPHGGTELGKAVTAINGIEHDRLIVITDEQSHDRVPDPIAKHAYMINVASNRNGVGYGRWCHIDGFSESVIKFIQAVEAE